GRKILCHDLPHIDAHRVMLFTGNAVGASRFRPRRSKPPLSTGPLSRLRDGTFGRRSGLSVAESGSSREAGMDQVCGSAGESQLRVLPDERASSHEAVGTPLSDSRTELPPVIRRAEVVAFALVALLTICVVAVLYAAKAFFLPVVTAFVVGTMLSPAAG